MDMSYFCANCMEKISTYQDTCPHCGFCNTDYTPPSHALVPMTVLQGRYLIGRVLGAGGFGITYVARDLKVDKKVCIKEFFVRGSMYREGSTSEMVSLITDGNVSERLYYANLEKFEQEAKILGRFDNVPGIVGVSDYFHENNTAYIVMEYLEGITLKAYVQSNGGRITWEDFLALKGYIAGHTVPIVVDGVQSVDAYINPIPSGLVLTGIVVSVSVTALMLSLTIRLYRRYQTLDLDEISKRLKKEGL